MTAASLRRPAIFRIAFRDFLRRPVQTTLVVGGLLVASLVLSAALVAGDSQEAMFLESVYRGWDQLDIVVGDVAGRPFAESDGRKVLETPSVKALIDGGSVRTQLVASADLVARGTREQVVNLVGIDPNLDRTLGNLYSLEEISSPQGSLTVFINQRLAERLNAHPGDEIHFVGRGVEGSPLNIIARVATIVQNRGKADWNLRPNAFITLDSLNRGAGRAGLVNQIVLSAKGGPRSPRDLPVLERETLKAIHGLIPPSQGDNPEAQRFRVAAKKAHALVLAKEQSRFLRSILGGLAILVVVTSIALIVNLFVMLGEERRSSQGMMRALGLRRSGLVLLGLIEGFLYAGTAALIGSLLGVFIGNLLGKAMSELFASFAMEAAVEFVTPAFNVKPSTLLTAASAGFLVTAVSVMGVSVRTSRLTVVAAIRGLPEERKLRRRTMILQILALLAGGGLFSFGVGKDEKFSLLAGGTLAILALTAIASRVLPRRIASSAGAVTMLGWGLWGYILLPDFDTEFETAFAVATTAAIIIVLSGVVLLGVNLTLFERLGLLFGPRARAVIRAATSYAVGYRFRTVMNMAMFALVLYMVGAFAVWGGLVGGDVVRESGGFKVAARSSLPVKGLQSDAAADVVSMFYTRYELGYRVGDSRPVDFPVGLYGVDDAMSSASNFEFTDIIPGENEKSVWLRLAASNKEIILDTGTNPGGAKPGQIVTLNTGGGKRNFKLIGIVDEFWLTGMYVSKGAFEQIYPTRAGDTAFLLKPKAGVSDAALVADLEKQNRAIGLDAQRVEEIFREASQQQRTFVGLFQVLLKLGLIIGVTGLAIGAVRAVLERRQAVGIVRALGFKRSMVGAWLLVEAGLITTLGCVIGLTAGLLGTYLLISTQLPGFSFRADWSEVTSTLALVYAAVFLFTSVPAWRAARTHPAEAIRYLE